MTEHDDSQCPVLHVRLDYSVVVFDKNKGTEALFTWFHKVFSRQNPVSARDFEVTWTDDDGEPVLEVFQHNLNFPAHALIAMFEAYRSGPSEETVNETTALPN